MKTVKSVNILFPVVFMLGLLQTGCYMLKQGSYLLSDRLHAVPIEKIIKSDSLTLEEQLFFGRIASVLEFTETVLGLEESPNYKTYIRTDRPYLAAVVSGAGMFSTAAYLWTFPIIGKVPYKGFFELEDALIEADKLGRKGFDTWVRGVDAFSTLGITHDPLYSFMTDYPEHRIAELIIHEQIHAAIWVPHESQFNEEMASFIGEIGAEHYIVAVYGENSREMLLLLAEKRDRIRWLEDVTELRKELETLYEQNIPSPDKELQKQKIITGFKDDFRVSYPDRYETDTYSKIPDLEINNAFIALYIVYYEHNNLLVRLYNSCKKKVSSLQGLKSMIEILRPLAGNGENPYDYIRNILDDFNP
ncbi:MAG: aminopeptidase [Spirochaetales bacterium]|nr:aminopeptidase [Spirochaetales bacterium]